MKKRISQIFWTITGLFLMLLGLIGVFLPIMPGPLFMIAGAICLGAEKKFIEKYLDKYLRKFKKN